MTSLSQSGYFRRIYFYRNIMGLGLLYTKNEYQHTKKCFFTQKHTKKILEKFLKKS